ncbi:MAG: type II toxin-antitoxin system VapC family toxin [Acidimicrobiia bacterium]|nr:type II toxin-antitoxin system VapC family toxin [Acidimicrobiia bacterium]
MGAAAVIVDTHVWLWMLVEPGRLSPAARRAVTSSGTDVYVSAASTWEIAIKHQLGRLQLPEAPASYVPTRILASGCTALPIEVAHTLRAGDLPPFHRDPFDRLLVAQAQILGIPLITSDPALHRYDIERIDT